MPSRSAPVALAALLGASLAAAAAGAGEGASLPATPEARWLAEQSVPVGAAEPDPGLDALLDAVGDARVVLLGEPSHGDGAAFALSSRAALRLWRERGFSILAFESGWADVDAVDRALVAGLPLDLALGKGIFGIWSGAAEMRPLFEAIAAARSGPASLRLAGIDPQVTGTGSADDLLPELERWIASGRLPKLERSTRRALTELLPSLVDVRTAAPVRFDRRQLDQLAGALAELGRALRAAPAPESERARLEFLARASDNLALFARIEHGVDPQDRAEQLAAGDLRDVQMADNLVALLEREPGARVLVWGASRHTLRRIEEILDLRRQPQYPERRAMGEELRRRLGDGAIYSIGVVAGGGFHGKSWEAPRPLRTPIPGSLEAHWLASGTGDAFLDLRRRRAGDDWLHRPSVARPLGYTEMLAPWARIFDGLLFVREMTPATRVVRAPEGSAPSPGTTPAPVPTSASASPPPAAGTLAIEPATGLRFRFVPPGTGRIGSPASELGRRPQEPLRTVTLARGLWLMEREVTQRLWREVARSRPSYFAHCGEDCPVESVDWFEAVAFANRLSEKAGLDACYELSGCSGTLGGGCPDRSARRCEEGYSCRAVRRVADCRGFRLPTEAEWEIAARAGVASALPEGELALEAINDAPGLDAWAWYGGNSGAHYRGAFACASWEGRQSPSRWCGPQPVATRRANAWGFHDLLGNVLEFTEDAIAWNDTLGRLVSSTDALAESVDPVGTEGDRRVLRGGSWYAFPRDTRFAHRGSMRPTTRNQTVGFRLALAAESLRAADSN